VKKKRSLGAPKQLHEDHADHSEKHDRDCPAIKATAQVVVGVAGGTAPVTFHCFDLVPLTHETPDTDSDRPFTSFDRPPLRSVPIYISLLTLRN